MTLPFRPAGFMALLLTTLCLGVAHAEDPLPHLQRQGDATQLVVHGAPFLVRGGELGNSSASSMAWMEPAWPKLADMHVNTVLAPVYWELLEPEEGEFDFTLVDELLAEARVQDMKLVLLWFGAWKNSMSAYVPAWVKTDPGRFPRALDADGVPQEILTVFSEENLRADRAAFVRLMDHLRRVDSRDHTVIMVQVENEIGMLPTARDHHPAANAAWTGAVPADLLAALAERADAGALVPEMAAWWEERGAPDAGSWEAVFGPGSRSEELFMAWYYARWVQELVVAGRDAWDLPMFVNAALNRPGREPGSGYPSAGPLPHLMDVWKAGAPDLDFLAPDFYTPRFRHWSDLYTRQGDPLFVPEHRFDDTAAAKALFAFGHYEAIGFAPFSIETGGEAERALLAGAFDLVRQLEPLMTAHQGRDAIDGVLLDHELREETRQFGDWTFHFRHDHTLGWSPGSDAPEWPAASVIVVRTDEDDFVIAGTGVVVTFSRANGQAGILTAQEGRFDDGEWRPGRTLNGDQTHQGRHIRIPVGQWDLQRFSLYRY